MTEHGTAERTVTPHMRLQDNIRTEYCSRGGHTCIYTETPHRYVWYVCVKESYVWWVHMYNICVGLFY